MVPITFDPPPDNADPVVRFTEVIDREGRRVTLAVDAEDPDGDALTYTFDWGDGSPVDVTGGGIASHRYAPEQVGVITARVTIDDGRGGQATSEVDFEFAAPDPNQPPAFELVQIIERDGFAITMAVHGVDPDGDPLVYAFDWGDESAPIEQNGGVAQHTYPTALGQQYTVTVTVSDPTGQTKPTRLPAPEANHDPIFDLVMKSVEMVFPSPWQPAHRTRMVTRLSTTSPGTTVSRARLWAVAAHTFADYGSYLVVVTASDGRGGVSIAPILLNEAPPPNAEPPETLRLVKQGPFTVSAFGAHDADADDLRFEFDWGDGSDIEERETGVAAHQYAEDVFRTYTVTVTWTMDGVDVTH